jgi:hypothetical protein
MNTREAYLEKCIELLKPDFEVAGFPLPDVKVSVGFPSRSALGTKKRRIGECWSFKAAADKKFHIFISPLLGNVAEVLATLVHEACHAAVDTECKHRGPFRTCALSIGLEGKMTETVAGPILKARLEEVAAQVGPYPHGALTFTSGQKKQTCRQIKVHCPECECICRMSRKCIDEIGPPTCACGTQMEEADDAGEREESD